MRTRLCLALFLSFTFLPAARADTILNFTLTGDISGVTDDHSHSPISFPGSPSGTVRIDTTTGVIEDIDLTFTNLNTNGLIDEPFIFGLEFGNSWYSTDAAGQQVYDLDIFLPVNSLIGYTGGPICSESNPCGQDGFTISDAELDIKTADFLDGSLSLTPEPSGLILLSTGALAPLLIRRRQQTSQA